MPEIKFQSATDGLGNWSTPANPEEVENALTEWAFDTAPRSSLSLIQTNDALADMDLKRGKNGQYNPQSYSAAYALSYARVHLLGRRFSCGDTVTEKVTEEDIDNLPPDILAVYVSRAEGSGLLKKKAGTAPQSD